MQTYTALVLVNELLQQMGHLPVSDVTSKRGAMGLSFINDAVEEILNNAEWDFAKRHDGVLYTMALEETTVGSDITADDIPVTFSDLAVAVPTGENSLSLASDYDPAKPSACPWIQISGDDVLDNGSYKVWAYAAFTTRHIRIGPPEITGSETLVAGENWEGGSHDLASGTLTAKVFAHEYVMPDTVRAILNVSVHGDNIQLTAVSDDVSTPTLFPDPANHISDDLWNVFAGGTTFKYTSPIDFWTATTPRQLRVVLYPTPSSKYKIDYSYLYRYPELTAATDTLRIPATVKKLIVQHAYYDSETTQVGNNPEIGERGLQRTEREARQANQQINPAKRARYGLGEFGSRYGRYPANPRWANQQPPDID